MNDVLRVGVITRTHGIKGEVKVYPTTDSPRMFEEIEDVTLRTGNKEKYFKIDSARYFKGLAILKLRGIDSIEAAEALRGGELYIKRSDAAEPGENEYYIADLIGMEVYDEAGALLGILKDVIETGANDVYLIGREGQKELLLPAIRDCIKEVDVEHNKMLVHVMDGLLDL